MGLIEDVSRGPVALDTAIFIYFIEEHPSFLPLVEPLFNAIDARRLRAFTSGLTLLEVLVAPLRAGNLSLAERYEALLTHSRGLHVVDVDYAQLRAAAELRAMYPTVRTPDALQLAGSLAFQFVVEGLEADAEDLGGSLLVATDVGERDVDEGLFGGFERRADADLDERSAPFRRPCSQLQTDEPPRP